MTQANSQSKPIESLPIESLPIESLPIELVVLDLDGTIYGQEFDGGFSPRVRRTIAAVQAAGVPVTIATGRVFDFVRGVAPALGVTLPVITAQGAVLADPISGAVIHETLLPLDAARNAAEWADGEERTTVFYLNDPDGRTRLVQNRERWESRLYDHWFGTPRSIRSRLADSLGAGGVRPLKFITVNDQAQEPDLTPVLQARFGGSVQMSRSHQLLIEGTAPGVDKGAGLRRLSERLGIDPAHVLAIGDNENDIPLLRAAGVAVAMGQATPVVRAEADWIAPALQEDGAAVAMERFVLGQF